MEEVKGLNVNQLEGGETLSSQGDEKASKKDFYQNNLKDQYHLPKKYGIDKIVLQVKNPKTAHLYWEYSTGRLDQLLSQLGYEDINDDVLVLRVYNLSLDRNYNNYYEIGIKLADDSCYLNDLEVNNIYLVRLGALDKEGEFHSILESNTIKMPINSVSDMLDQEWMIVQSKMEEIYILSSQGLINDKRRYSSSDVIKKVAEKQRKEGLKFKLKQSYSSNEVLKIK
ncbi:hypothetical protein BX659_102222 [Orenia metallireducens]|uniref:DUF4912 domain-containing protein n=1 Tax=Orenia metallireducens TaxID=1413210 RepID=A0A285F7F0_9FIRM|nr:DUF4912 domain-containing protein [Orenia metallireducens]PRX34904.1 hypothetical protein BX659_102222 [Orenia metallireducens]SNY06131.1 hypothetical protein SAMN06265827_101222 [Orenia metallireducens]